MVLSASPLFFISGVGNGPSEAFSLVLLIFVYVTVRMLRLLDFKMTGRRFVQIATGYLLLVGIGYVMYTILFASASDAYYRIPRIAGYNMPHVWIMAIGVVMWFAQCARVNGWLSRCLSFCAPSMFGIYLFHHTTSFGHKVFLALEDYLCTFLSSPLVVCFWAACLVFLFGLLVDFVRRLMWKTFLRAYWTAGARRAKL